MLFSAATYRLVVQLETTLSTLKVRRTVLTIISQWEEFPFVELAKHDPQSLIDLLKLAAAEFLASSTDVGMNENNPILNAFKEKFAGMVTFPSYSMVSLAAS